MRILVMIMLLFFCTVKVQAATLTLKDGRNITGDILNQNDLKVVIKVNDETLTYFRDEIDSIDGKSFVEASPTVAPDGDKPTVAQDVDKPTVAPDVDKSSVAPDADMPPVAPDPEKEKLVDQLLKILPTDQVVLQLTKDIVPENQKDYFITFLKDNSDFQKIEEIRRKGLMEFYSIDDLKLKISILTSSDNKEFQKHLAAYNKKILSELHKILAGDAKKALSGSSDPKI